MVRFKIDLSISQFKTLHESCFKGYEMLVVKPTKEYSNLAQICEHVLEGADDVFDIAGFDCDLHLNIEYVMRR